MTAHYCVHTHSIWISILVPKTTPKLYPLRPTLLGSLWALASTGPASWDGWLKVSAVGTALFFPPLQFLPPFGLLFTHAIPEGLHLWLALAPILVLGHALLHCKVGGSAAGAGDQLVQGVFFLSILLHLSGPGMALRD